MVQELLTPEEMAAVDRAAARLGTPVARLMANAGRAVARAVRRRYPPCRTLVLCGPGNNGGDGIVAAEALSRAGWSVAVASPGPLPFAWSGVRVPFDPGQAARAGLVVDALYGAGLTRELSAGAADVLGAARRVVAVDVPSGLDGATGQPRGRVRGCELTVTFVRCKPGHLLLPGRDLCGELVVAAIGMPQAALRAVTPKAFHNLPGLWRLPELGVDGHKYSRGHVTVLGGAAMTGAARLAAGAARRAGAGLVSLAVPPGAAATYRAGEPGTIVTAAELSELLADERRTVWVCGPGLGAEEAARALPVLLGAGREVVVDADALTLCAGDPTRLRGASVLTPHGGEFARVFGPAGVDRVAAARAAAALTGAVVVLKGSDTIVAAPDGRVAINDSAPPWLATAGSGDVLAGITAAMLAQGLPAWEAAAAAVWLHGRAGHFAGRHLIAEDLASALPAAFADAGVADLV